MSLSLLITINVLADIALLAGVAHVMSRATRLKPHIASLDAQPLQAEETPAAQRHPRAARSARPELARARASAPGHAGAHATAAGES
ncbi:MAG TPA: hypothetical protein VGI27_12415 [Solirubrobacteraceae bacterium]|jgi:hypothetical protein